MTAKITTAVLLVVAAAVALLVFRKHLVAPTPTTPVAAPPEAQPVPPLPVLFKNPLTSPPTPSTTQKILASSTLRSPIAGKFILPSGGMLL